MKIFHSLVNSVQCSCILYAVGPADFLPHPINLSTDATKTSQEHYAMENGRMVSRRHGELSEMVEEATLNDGSSVNTQGLVLRTNGETHQLLEGEAITLAGRIQSHESVMNPDIPTGEYHG